MMAQVALRARRPIKRRKYLESDLQRNIFKLLGYYPRIREMATATGAGGKRNLREASRMKSEGLTAGFPDLAIYFPSGIHSGFFCELKRPGGRLTELQREKLEKLCAKGYYVCVCDNVEDFQKHLVQYFGRELSEV